MARTLSTFRVAPAIAAVVAVAAASATATAPASDAAATTEDSREVTVTVDTESRSSGLTTFSGSVSGGPKRGMVKLQKATEGAWRTVASSDFTPRGYSVRYPSEDGKYRIKAPLKTWYNSKRWYDQEHGGEWDGPTSATSQKVALSGESQGEGPRKWVIGVGDSYMSGEGASYAGYGPWCGASHDNILPWKDCKYTDQSDRWWISAFGSSLRQTYPGDFEQPIAQPALGADRSAYRVDLSGVRCHRSASALMYWNRADYAAMNLACSGAVLGTDLATGKPGVDFVDEQTQSGGRIVGQALQLQRFAQKVKAQGDAIKVVSLSIGGNDIGFGDIVANCVERFLTPGKSACWKADSDSAARRAYDGGNGLLKARDAVITAGQNIVKALDAAGVERGSYTIAVQTYPIGVPPANQFQGDFGGNSGYGRQGIGGCGLTDGDLDFFNGDFGNLLNRRTIQGASALSREFGTVPVTVVDASQAVKDHQLCSNRVNYPATKSDGNNTLTPLWNGDWGGRKGGWITPVIVNCMGSDDWKTCYEGDSPATLYPTLWKAVDGSGGYRSPGWYEGVKQMAQLPVHPNYWGQRALATCHSTVATDPGAAGFVMKCVPRDGDLDAFGRPSMTVTKGSGL